MNMLMVVGMFMVMAATVMVVAVFLIVVVLMAVAAVMLMAMFVAVDMSGNGLRLHGRFVGMSVFGQTAAEQIFHVMVVIFMGASRRTSKSHTSRPDFFTRLTATENPSTGRERSARSSAPFPLQV